MSEKEIGTVISGIESPSPSNLDFVVNQGAVHRGQFVELDYSEGTMICLVTDVYKTNRYFERAESVKEFESSGAKLFEQFPTHEWEYLVAKTRPLGVFKGNITNRATLPPGPGTRVRIASNENLTKFFHFEKEGLNLGIVENHDLPVQISMNNLLKKHIAILAQSGFGKCVSPSTKILLQNGDEQEIGYFVDEMLSKGFEVEDGVEFRRNTDSNLEVFSIDNKNKIKKSKILAFCRRKAPEKMVRIKTLTGKVIELTPEHQVPVLDEGVDWIQAQNLREGDSLFLPKPIISGAEKKIGLNYSIKGADFSRIIKVDRDFATVFAYLLAEGHNTGKCLSFTNCSDKIQERFSQLCLKVFGVKPKKIKRENEVRIYSKTLALALQKIGFTNSSWTKFVPKELLKSKKEVLAAFLSALIDCDGYISKRSGLEICLASKKIIDSVDSMLLRFGIVSLQRQKTVKEKKYARLSVSDSKSLAVLRENLCLLIDYKKRNLEICAKRKYNTNIAVVPKINKKIRQIMKLLNMSLSQANSTGISNYLYRKDNPSFPSLQNLVNSFEERHLFLELKISEARQLFYSLPNYSEEDAKTIVSEAYANFDFNQIAKNSSISSTTARRLVRGITAPTQSAFVLAKNALLLQDETDIGIDTITELDFTETASKINSLCIEMGFEVKQLCKESHLHKCYLYAAATNSRAGTYSSIYSLLKNLFGQALQLEQNLNHAKKAILFLKSLANSNLFFDKIQSTESFKPDFDYVYDLSVENKNFCANHLIIHNSYLVSVLFEELLERKKDSGRIGVIVFDPHGEYSSFAERNISKEKISYNEKTILVKASDIKIGVPKLSAGSFASLIPGLTSIMKRELGKILSELQKQMRSGKGPFDLHSLMDAISDAEINENTKNALLAWLSELNELNLFDKIDSPSVFDLVQPGKLTIIDLSDLIDLRKKQIIVSYFSRRLFYERRAKSIPPFLLVLEEAHQFCPEKASEEAAISRGIIQTIAREGRKFGCSLCIISQRPIQLSTTVLAQCSTHIILRITNPYDLKHIGESSEGLDSRAQEMITSLRVGEALIVGEATHYPLFFKVRQRKSSESKHEVSLEKAALDFESAKEEKRKETEEFL